MIAHNKLTGKHIAQMADDRASKNDPWEIWFTWNYSNSDSQFIIESILMHL